MTLAQSLPHAGQSGLFEVEVATESLDPFRAVLRAEEYERVLDRAELARRLLVNRAIWNVTSTARGGGVAETLTALLPLARGAGLDARWLVIRADPEFFRLTKRVHNRLHGNAGDNGPLCAEEHELYEEVLAPVSTQLRSLVRPGDVVILHDPQTAGLAPVMQSCGSHVIWRCHVGVDVPNPLVQSAWAFLLRYLEHAAAYVFTRTAYVPDDLDRERVAIIPPSIDAFSPKNQPLARAQVEGILARTGLVMGRAAHATFIREDGSDGLVTRTSDVLGGMVPAGAPIVTQISRWDRLKDPAGVVLGFVEHVIPASDAHLVVAGPAVAAVADDPEGAAVFREISELWQDLSPERRARVHLACLPMDDIEENAAIVNALQRRAAVVVQKSLAEGFGLTVAEAMWKERAIVASRVGGIQDQLTDGVDGLLVDPNDQLAFGRALLAVLLDPALAERLGQTARQRCRSEYLGPGHLIRYVEVFERLLRDPPAKSPTIERSDRPTRTPGRSRPAAKRNRKRSRRRRA